MDSNITHSVQFAPDDHENFPRTSLFQKYGPTQHNIRSSHTGRLGAGVEDLEGRSAPNVAPMPLIRLPIHMPTCSLIGDGKLCGWAPALQENVTRNIGAGYGTASKYIISAVAAVFRAERVL